MFFFAHEQFLLQHLVQPQAIVCIISCGQAWRVDCTGINCPSVVLTWFYIRIANVSTLVDCSCQRRTFDTFFICVLHGRYRSVSRVYLLFRNVCTRSLPRLAPSNISPMLAYTETTSSSACFTNCAVIRAGPWSPSAKSSNAGMSICMILLIKVFFPVKYMGSLWYLSHSND